MKAKLISTSELSARAIRILCRELGVANTGRFLGQFTTGFGDYTKERDGLIGKSSVQEIAEMIGDRRASGSGTRSSKRTSGGRGHVRKTKKKN